MKEDSFEKAFTNLEKIIDKMQNAEVSLEESVVLYEKAKSHLEICQKRLEEASLKIKTINEDK